MKKLLVLSLVLAVAGLANAGYTLAVEGNQVIVGNTEDLVGGINVAVGIIGPEGLFGAYTFRTNGAPNTEKAFYTYSYADLGGAEGGMPWTGGLQNVVWGDAVLAPNPSGEWFRLEILGPCTVALADGNGTALEGVAPVQIVPEPMTMGLLGLGALFLRKRK